MLHLCLIFTVFRGYYASDLLFFISLTNQNIPQKFISLIYLSFELSQKALIPRIHVQKMACIVTIVLENQIGLLWVISLGKQSSKNIISDFISA